jgi:hypothetical protein
MDGNIMIEVFNKKTGKLFCVFADSAIEAIAKSADYISDDTRITILG